MYYENFLEPTHEKFLNTPLSTASPIKEKVRVNLYSIVRPTAQINSILSTTGFHENGHGLRGGHTSNFADRTINTSKKMFSSTR